MKPALNEIKKNLQGTNSEGKEVWVQINDLEHKEDYMKVGESKLGIGYRRVNEIMFFLKGGYCFQGV